jgi:hypothetical protein
MKKVDQLTQKIEELRSYVDDKRSKAKSKSDIAFLDGVVYVLSELNERTQGLEREVGHSGAFIDPARAPDLPNKII